MLVPESGDDVQLMKAGLIEIADLFIVNKSDREGSDRLAQSIRNVLHIFKNKDNHEPPVFKVSANNGNGIKELYAGIAEIINEMKNKDFFEQKRIARYRDRVLNLVQGSLISNFWTDKKLKKLEAIIKGLEVSDSSPHETAEKILNQS